MDEHDEDQLKKEKERQKALEKENECPPIKPCPGKKKKKNKKKKQKKICKSAEMLYDFDEAAEAEKQLCMQKQKAKQQTTKELVGFLKELMDAEQQKKEITKEDKAVSPYTSEEELQTIVYSELSEEFLEEEAEEEEIEEEEEEEDEVELTGINKDAEGYVDMDEVKKRLEDMQNEEMFEDVEDEYEDEEDEFLEGEFDWALTDSAVKPLTQDVSAQFNYFLERKAVLAKTPRNITEDLTQFMRIVIMGDNGLREIMKEKELVQFKRKQLDFMTMGMLIKKPKHCQCIKDKKKKGGKKGKCKCKCCATKKGRKGKIICEEDKDMTYNIRPNEFMLMLQVLMNTLEVIEEQDRLLQPSEETILVSEASTTRFIPEEFDDVEEEEEEEDINVDDDDDDDV